MELSHIILSNRLFQMLLAEKVYVQVRAIQFIFTEAEICRDVGAGGGGALTPQFCQNLLFALNFGNSMLPEPPHFQIHSDILDLNI